MKNFLNSTLYLFVFAFAGIVFQISCSNDDASKSNVVNNSPMGKIVYIKSTGVSKQLWTANYDGTNQTQIMVNFPPNVNFVQVTNGTQPRISPDGQKIFFVGIDNSGGTAHVAIYSCDSTGNNVQEVVPATNSEDIEIGNAI